MADITVNNDVAGASSECSRRVVFLSSLIGYAFFIRLTGGRVVYSKTIDGGQSWAAPVNVSTATACTAFDIWYDQDTPGIIVH
jgi:hypothetical protein